MERLTEKITDKRTGEVLAYRVKCKKDVESVQKLGRLEDLEEQGKLLKLPCAVGDTVYVLDRDGKPREMILDAPDIRCHCSKEDNLCMVLCDKKNTGVCAYRFKNDGSDIGKKAFLTREEAEAALKESKIKETGK